MLIEFSHFTRGKHRTQVFDTAAIRNVLEMAFDTFCIASLDDFRDNFGKPDFDDGDADWWVAVKLFSDRAGMLMHWERGEGTAVLLEDNHEPRKESPTAVRSARRIASEYEDRLGRPDRDAAQRENAADQRDHERRNGD